MKQWGRVFHIEEYWCRINPLDQNSIKPFTWQGITQDTPKRERTMSHNSLAKWQWMKIWSTDSLAVLHIQHLLTITRPLFLRLSIVGSLPSAALQVKNDTRGGTLGFQRKGLDNYSRTAQKSPSSRFYSNRIYPPHFHLAEESISNPWKKSVILVANPEYSKKNLYPNAKLHF